MFDKDDEQNIMMKDISEDIQHHNIEISTFTFGTGRETYLMLLSNLIFFSAIYLFSNYLSLFIAVAL